MAVLSLNIVFYYGDFYAIIQIFNCCYFFIIEILDKIAYKVGAISNREVDYDKVYNIILKDLREGRFKGVTFDSYEDR